MKENYLNILGTMDISLPDEGNKEQEVPKVLTLLGYRVSISKIRGLKGVPPLSMNGLIKLYETAALALRMELPPSRWSRIGRTDENGSQSLN